ncbi:hypothetical protein CPB84DRAFT_1788116 [Gymnopilus junonius]|uniref:Uncharacterized protein n=1 Tax=Gymnopilus junonius TaxID=109634 RepID=A0A9P5NHK4_GYMJU|nr:hypothetical protein CPB84DRAFT_1788116 [Gymnopilus junonius]
MGCRLLCVSFAIRNFLTVHLQMVGYLAHRADRFVKAYHHSLFISACSSFHLVALIVSVKLSSLGFQPALQPQTEGGSARPSRTLFGITCFTSSSLSLCGKACSSQHVPHLRILYCIRSHSFGKHTKTKSKKI